PWSLVVVSKVPAGTTQVATSATTIIPNSSTRVCGTLTALPPTLAALVLLLQVTHQRREVVDDRGRVHLARTRQLLERVLPRLALAEREHRSQLLAGFLAAVDRALVQRA